MVTARDRRTELIVDMSPVPDNIEPVDSVVRILFFILIRQKNFSMLYFLIKLTGSMNHQIINQSGMLISDYNAEVITVVTVTN